MAKFIPFLSTFCDNISFSLEIVALNSKAYFIGLAVITSVGSVDFQNYTDFPLTGNSVYKIPVLTKVLY